MDAPATSALSADFTLLLVEVPPSALPSGQVRRVRWPDFWVPLDRADALDALREALHRSRSGERVDVACLGAKGRTGTALAALAILDGGLDPAAAVRWVRDTYHPHAVETPWQRWWLRGVR